MSNKPKRQPGRRKKTNEDKKVDRRKATKLQSEIKVMKAKLQPPVATPTTAAPARASTWEPVHRQYEACRNLLATAHNGFSLLQDTRITSLLTPAERSQCMVLAKTLANDYKSLETKLNQLYASHKDKNDIQHGDEIMESFAAYEWYVSWIDEFNNVVINGTLNDIDNILSPAIQKAKENDHTTA